MKTITTFTCALGFAVSLILAPPAESQGCVAFQGIDHCPVGNAILQGGGDSGLSVTALGSEGKDGVSARFAPTTHWQAEMEFPAGTSEDNRLHLSSISAGEVTSELFIEPVGGGHEVQASFTGDAGESTYSVLVYKEGILQGALGGFSSQSAASPTQLGNHIASADKLQNTAMTDPEGSRITFSLSALIRRIRRGRFGIANNGGCNWGLEFSDAVAVRLPDGTEVTGDEIRIEEDVRGPNHYPYLGFESIQTLTSVESFRITQELAEGNG